MASIDRGEWLMLLEYRVAISAAVLALAVATPVFANDIANCNQSADADLRIQGCTGFIHTGVSGRNLAIALVNRGIALDVKNETRRAIKDFDAAIVANPDYSIAFYNRGIAHSDLGLLDQAIADFTSAIEIDPTDADAYDARGFALADLREFHAAIDDLTKAIELDPEFSSAYYHRGIVYGKMGEFDLGIADYDKALSMGCLRHGWCPAR